VADLADLAERLRELALSLPETYEDEPRGHPVFKVAENKMFASMDVAEECVRLTVKLTAEEREIAQLLPFVSTARYVGRYGWVTAEVADEESLEAALEWLRESYWLKARYDQKRVVEGWTDEERRSRGLPMESQAQPSGDPDQPAPEARSRPGSGRGRSRRRGGRSGR